MRNSTFSLKVVDGPGVSNICVLSHDGPLIFGRLQTNDCVLTNDVSISRKHFEICKREGKFWIKDLNSRNGTYLNDRPVLTSELKQGDKIRVGKTRLLIEIGSHENDDVVSIHSSGVASRSNIGVRDSQTTEIISARTLHSGKLAKKRILDDNFAHAFLDLPGCAILINGDVVDSIKQNPVNESVFINHDSCLVFPANFDAWQKVLLFSFGSTSTLFLNHTSPRTNLIAHITACLHKFGASGNFLSEYQELPTEIAIGLLKGIDLVVCDTQDPDVAAAIFEKQHAKWLGEVVSTDEV